jgi:predicted nucleic acid-binding protein
VGTLALPPHGGVVFVDSNILIYSVEQVVAYSGVLRPLWESTRNGELTVRASALVMAEVLPIPLRKGDAALVAAFHDVFRSGEVERLPVDDPVLHRAAELRAAHNLRTPDAIHAATALLAPTCDLFLTNDDAFRRVPNLPVTLLRDVLAAP